MLSQHCTGGAQEVMVAFYAESALHGRCTGGAREVMVAFYAVSALHGRCAGGCAGGDGGILC